MWGDESLNQKALRSWVVSLSLSPFLPSTRSSVSPSFSLHSPLEVLEVRLKALPWRPPFPSEELSRRPGQAARVGTQLPGCWELVAARKDCWEQDNEMKRLAPSPLLPASLGTGPGTWGTSALRPRGGGQEGPCKVSTRSAPQRVLSTAGWAWKQRGSTHTFMFSPPSPPRREQDEGPVSFVHLSRLFISTVTQHRT